MGSRPTIASLQAEVAGLKAKNRELENLQGVIQARLRNAHRRREEAERILVARGDALREISRAKRFTPASTLKKRAERSLNART